MPTPRVCAHRHVCAETSPASQCSPSPCPHLSRIVIITQCAPRRAGEAAGPSARCPRGRYRPQLGQQKWPRQMLSACPMWRALPRGAHGRQIMLPLPSTNRVYTTTTLLHTTTLPSLGIRMFGALHVCEPTFPLLPRTAGYSHEPWKTPRFSAKKPRPIHYVGKSKLSIQTESALSHTHPPTRNASPLPGISCFATFCAPVVSCSPNPKHALTSPPVSLFAAHPHTQQ